MVRQEPFLMIRMSQKNSPYTQDENSCLPHVAKRSSLRIRAKCSSNGEHHAPSDEFGISETCLFSHGINFAVAPITHQDVST